MINEFRRGIGVNLLIATQAALRSDLPRCSLVVCLQPPTCLADYLASKARSRLVGAGATLVHLVEESGHLEPEYNNEIVRNNSPAMSLNKNKVDGISKENISVVPVQRGDHILERYLLIALISLYYYTIRLIFHISYTFGTGCLAYLNFILDTCAFRLIS
ncbi:unnamed protein product [Protopolystoma xenopodis]|uniref:Uncharacterized protein n=1 Tax=Protopolystoma xenopodis TaxID=117903 RepID=A0A448XII0_9PLAT|nr:unnamed protein product [Protopolystoma xenopodis]